PPGIMLLPAHRQPPARYQAPVRYQAPDRHPAPADIQLLPTIPPSSLPSNSCPTSSSLSSSYRLSSSYLLSSACPLSTSCLPLLCLGFSFSSCLIVLVEVAGVEEVWRRQAC